MQTFEINGAAIDDIASLYTELNRVFMADEDWQLGETLDGFNDLLYGGFGAMPSDGSVQLLWHDLDHTREALGVAATRGWLEAKLATPGFNHDSIQADLDALERGEGQTYFDILMEIIGEHDRVSLQAD